MKWIKITTLALSIAVTTSHARTSPPPAQKATRKTNTNPEAARIVTSDIGLFWKAYDAARPADDLIVYRDQYLTKGSPGLQAFTRLRIFTPCGLVETIEKHPNYYASIRKSTLKVDSYKERIRASFRRFKALYDSAVFPDVYFLMKDRSSARIRDREIR
jgi:hypothetical protein